MAEKLPMLALSPTMEEGVVAQWLKAVGDTVESGETVCEVETDKATMEYQSMAEGVLLKIIVDEGGQAKVGDAIAIVGEEGEDVEALVAESTAAAAASSAPVKAQAEDADNEEIVVEAQKAVPRRQAVPRGGKVRATPAARGLAAEHGVLLESIDGSGPNGRIVLADVSGAIDAGKGGAVAGRATSFTSSPVEILPDDEVIPLTEKRKIIAQRLSASKFTAPHFYLKLRVEMDELMGLRKRLNAMRDGKISFNAFLIKMVAQSLALNPVVNSSWNNDSIVQHGSADVALAVAVEGGLITPIVRNCASKSIATIDAELQVLIEKARNGKLTPEEFTGATFTISNLGSFGIEEFTAIINPPGSAILAVGKTMKTPVVGANDEILVKAMMALSLSCDHRVIDGAVGAKFMQDLQAMLQQPSLALA